MTSVSLGPGTTWNRSTPEGFVTVYRSGADAFTSNTVSADESKWNPYPRVLTNQGAALYERSSFAPGWSNVSVRTTRPDWSNELNFSPKP